MGHAVVRSLVPYNTTDAAFRAWGSQVSADLTAMGLPKTADTGQIDWATVARAGTNSNAGYEIRTFNDALQATAPVVFKLFYGSGNGSATSVGLQIQVGRASDGAGNLTAPVTTAQNIRGASNGTSASSPCILSGDVNRLALALFFATPSEGLFLSLERTKDQTGADTAEGVLMSTISSSDGRDNLYIPLTGPLLPSQSDSGIFTPAGVTTGATLTDVAVYPNFFFRSGQIQYPGLTHMGYFTTDVPVGSQGALEVYGQPHNYYFIGANSGHSLGFVARGGVSGTTLCLLFE